MTEPNLSKKLSSVTVVQNTSTDPENIYREIVRQFLENAGVKVFVTTVESKDCPIIPAEAENPDLVIVLGGDGTFLRASRCFVHQQVPLVGVNTGTLGFLTRIEADKVSVYLKSLIQGDYGIEERMMLAVQNAHGPDGNEDLALNDIVIKNGNPSQMCSLRVFINNSLVAIYDADGVIISTPTGSTAYTLSAGGPVISPEVEAISITPICPHSLSAKPIVIPANKTLRIESAHKNREVVCAVDGQETGTLKPGDSIILSRAPQPLRIINFKQEEDDFYLLLKKKLHWAMNPRWKTQSF
jgi:NAD+ kinase